MARISFPDRGLGEHVDWSLHRSKMAVGMGALSEAVYGNTQLPLRERESARWTIALINDCAVCRDTRARDGEQAGIDDGFYSEIASWRTSEALTDRERLAAEFAERFALDHLAMDDAFWGGCAAPSPTTRSPTSRSAAACSSGWGAPWRSSECGPPTSGFSSEASGR